MTFSSEQKHAMATHIRSNTIYDWHLFGTGSTGGLMHILTSIEQIIDSTESCTSDLLLPNCFIIGCENATFWRRMAEIASSDEATNWHELEFGSPLNRDDLRQRYVYTWSFKGDTYRFYTKILNEAYAPELVWFFSASKHDVDSSDETDSDEIA
jgi:hypothetical protein